jgi:hypothetical protein
LQCNPEFGSVAKNLPSVVKGLCEPWVREG